MDVCALKTRSSRGLLTVDAAPVRVTGAATASSSNVITRFDGDGDEEVVEATEEERPAKRERVEDEEIPSSKRAKPARGEDTPQKKDKKEKKEKKAKKSK